LALKLFCQVKQTVLWQFFVNIKITCYYGFEAGGKDFELGKKYGKIQG
jgi:hypothetical protein